MEAPTLLAERRASELALIMSCIPDDVVFNILARLPAKSLIRFSSVCKSWYSTITSHNFISSHLHLNLDKSHDYLILSSIPTYPLRRAIYQSSISTFYPFKMGPIYTNSNCFHFNWHMIGSYHGLLCFTGKTQFYGWLIHLWNPTIGQFKSISRTSLTCGLVSHHQVHVGFGFDAKNEDYKIVRIVDSTNKNEKLLQAEMYSLNAGAWKKVVFPMEISTLMDRMVLDDSTQCTLVNGALHWIARDDVEQDKDLFVILAFDLADEEFQLIAVPRDFVFDCHQEFLVSANGSLALISISEVGVAEELRLWLMKKYGAVESWSKLIILLEGGFSTCCGCTEDGKLLIMERSEVNAVDTETGEKKNLGIRNAQYVIPLIESLLLLD